MLAAPWMPLLAALLLFARAAAAGSMAAWYTGYGSPSLIMQDDDTGDIHYSLCNSQSTPIFPTGSSSALPLDGEDNPPRKNSSIAGNGYFDGNDNMATIQWQTDSGDIVNSLWKCGSDGHYTRSGSWVVSAGVAPSVHAQTGLKSMSLNAHDGYRIFYHDADGAIAFLTYTGGKWAYGGIVTHDALLAPIGAHWNTATNMTVVTPKDASNFEVSALQADYSWQLSTVPHPLQKVDGKQPTNSTSADALQVDENGPTGFQMEAWDGKAKSIGLTIGSDGGRSVFYVGTDRNLYQIKERDGSWQDNISKQLPSEWPQADSPGADMAYVSDAQTDRIWLYYLSGGGRMYQAYQSADGVWEQARALVDSDPNGDDDTSDSDPSSDSSDNGGGGGLAMGAKIGLGVGLGCGLTIVAAVLGLCVHNRCRQRRRAREAERRALADARAHAAAAEAVRKYHAESPFPPGGGGGSIYSGSSPTSPGVKSLLGGSSAAGGWMSATTAHGPSPWSAQTPGAPAPAYLAAGHWAPAPMYMDAMKPGADYKSPAGDSYYAATATTPQQQQQQQQQPQIIHEMPTPDNQLEMLGEGHYRELGEGGREPGEGGRQQ